MKVFIMDVNNCQGCYACQIACKDEHVGNDWTPYAKPQPDTGQFWGKLNEYVRGNIPHVKMSYVFVPCQHCTDAPCAAACAPKAITTRADGMVLIDPKKCTGCQNCVDACPYGAIYYNESLVAAQKCTGCAHLLDRGWKEPRCVDACPTGGLKFGEEADFKDVIAKAEVLPTVTGAAQPKVRVYYLGLPKRFIAGTVYDPATKEVVIGATVTLSGDGSATAKTNAWGDFWFDGLKVGTYSIKIEGGGKTKTIDKISTAKDVGLGDVPIA